jgi:hypothetical protein
MSDPKPEFASFEDFWPFYVRAHSNPTNRWFHFAGTTAAMLTLGAAVVTRKASLLKWVPVVGYGPAWIGHFFVEGNKPATFGHPLWSLRGDLVMWKKMLDGTMDAEVARCVAEHEAKQAATAEPASAPAEAPARPLDVN